MKTKNNNFNNTESTGRLKSVEIIFVEIESFVINAARHKRVLYITFE